MSSSFATLLDLLERTEFLAGIVAGLALLGVLALAALFRRGTAGWGVAIAVAVIIGVHLTIGRRLSLAAGIGFMAIGGALVGWRRHRDQWFAPLFVPSGWLAVVAGAIVATWRSGLPEGNWIPFALPVVAVAAGQALRYWNGPNAAYLGPLFLISAFGVWTAVPETREARVLLGVALVLAFASLPPLRTRISAAGAFAVGGTFTWVVAAGGAARPASVIGGWACLGVLALIPTLLRWADRPLTFRPAALFVAHGAAVLIAARVIGRWHSAALAVPAVILTAALVAAGLLILSSTAREKSSA